MINEEEKFNIQHSTFNIQFACFSPKQQQVLGICCLLYGIWLLWVVYADAQLTIETAPLTQPDPPELQVYIDPPINLNTSTSAELQLLPSVGPVMAQRIISYRDRYGLFTSFDALSNVKCIGPKTIKKLQYYLRIDN
jgi:competence ComEA-like helix-hairpin-helix protein